MDRVQIIIDSLETISCCENLANLTQDLERSSTYSQPVLGITLDFFFFFFFKDSPYILSFPGSEFQIFEIGKEMLHFLTMFLFSLANFTTIRKVQ